MATIPSMTVRMERRTFLLHQEHFLDYLRSQGIAISEQANVCTYMLTDSDQTQVSRLNPICVEVVE